MNETATTAATTITTVTGSPVYDQDEVGALIEQAVAAERARMLDALAVSPEVSETKDHKSLSRIVDMFISVEDVTIIRRFLSAVGHWHYRRVERAVVAEREACAKIADANAIFAEKDCGIRGYDCRPGTAGAKDASDDIAATIRARGGQKNFSEVVGEVDE